MARAAWTSSQARLTRDSFLPFGSCCLCLEATKDPVACQLGDIFCRECALANLVAQKKEIKRQHKAQLAAEREVEQAQAQADAEARKRAVQDFEGLQAGVTSGRTELSQPPAKRDGDTRSIEPKHGTKRKFDLDADEMERISKQDVARAKEAMAAEKAQKPTLPSFWTPSLTPTLDPAQALAARQKSKTTPICPASSDDGPHPMSQKHLISIKFTKEESPESKKPRRLCPSCMKLLSNASKPVLAKSCGHVFCRSCVTRLIDSSKDDPSLEQPHCYVCDSSLGSRGGDGDIPLDKKARTRLPNGLVELKTDGTGFSATGASIVERVTTNFQC